MPCYNSEQTISQSIDSVLEQTYPQWELIIIDDNSTDSSYSLVSEKSKQDDRIKLLRNNTNLGAAFSRNRAIEKANGRYIAFLDSDDIWLPDKLKKQISFMKDTRAVLSYTSYKIFRNNNILSVVHARPYTNYKQLLKYNHIGCLTAVYDAFLIGKQYMPTIRKRQDYALWLKILNQGHVAQGLDVPLALYRTGSRDSISHKKFNLLGYQWYLYHHLEKCNIFYSSFYMLTSSIYSLQKRFLKNIYS